MIQEVTTYIDNANRWKNEMRIIRAILLDCQLVECMKWRVPCYTFNNKNLFIIACFREFCALSFLKGSLLKDEQQLLISPGEASQSVKFMKFTNESGIEKLRDVIKQYIFEAIELEEKGVKVDKLASKEFELVIELQDELDKDKVLKKAFENLTIGRQRGYNIFIAGAKQSQTRLDRIEKYKSRILDGKGINDCVCGLSKKMPACDGSHNYLK
jgi:uncharacterized protein YdeI (YjbR/CyaY-like superfamily)